MPFCPSCGAEFRAGFTVCNTCGVDLVSTIEREPQPAARVKAEAHDIDESDEPLRLLGTFTDESTAALVRRLLDEGGIPSVSLGGHGPQIGSCKPWQILVDEDYVEAARETVASYQAPSLITGQIEGDIHRLSNDLSRLARERRELAPAVDSIRQTMERLRTQLEELNREIEE